MLDTLKLNPLSSNNNNKAADNLKIIIDNIRNTMELIRQSLSVFTAFQNTRDQELSKRLLSELKETEISLDKINARVGDKITIEIQTKTHQADLPRTLIIELQVKELGLINKISDSFLLIKPLIPQEADTNNVGETYIDSKQFTATAGVSYFWNYYARDSNNGWSDIARFLKPGFGINVSFPTYQPKIARYEVDEVSGSRQLVVEETEYSFMVSFGIVGSLFDNALQFTYGLNLSVGDTWAERAYFGIGFSFVNLGRRITSTSD
jgi:hypothetical protein